MLPTPFITLDHTMLRRVLSRLSAEQLEARDVPATAFGLGTGGIGLNTLFRFDTATPTTLSVGIPVTGLDAGSILVGTDFRPATGELYGLGRDLDMVRLYTIDPNTGAATPVGAAVQVVGTTTAVKYGVDFNPAADLLRVITDLASDGAGGNTNNFRISPIDGTLVGGAVDGDLNYTGLPGGIGDGPEVTVAYTNNDSDPTTATTLFGIVSSGDQLVINGTAGSPGVTLNSVGALGVDTGVNAGMDIFSPANTAVAILDLAAGSTLHTINLTTGAATSVGLVGDGTIDFLDVSVAPPAFPVVASGTKDGKVTLLTPTLYATTPGALTVGATVTAFAGSTANVRAATADINQDGVPDLVLVTGPGTPIRVTVISGVDNTTALIAPFDPFGGNFTGGGFLATGDFNADGKDDFVVTPDQGGGPRVSIFTRLANGNASTLANFLAFVDPNFFGGVRPAVGDVNGDGRLDLVVGAGFTGGPRTSLFNGTTLTSGGTPSRLVGDFFAFPGTDATNLRNGVFAAVSDINGDGFGDLIFGGGPGGAPRVFILSGAVVTGTGMGTGVAAAQAAPIANFFVANNSTDRGGVRVAGANLDNDFRGDLVIGSGEGSPAKVRAYLGKNFTTTNEPATFQDLSVLGGAALAGGVFVG